MYCKHRSGNTRGLTDEQGNLVQEYFYDVYGKCWNVTKDSINGYQYVGGYGVSADADDGLLYMRARYQDPARGIFLTQDPLWNCVRANSSYNYTSNSPFVFVDYTGKIRAKTGEECDKLEIFRWIEIAQDELDFWERQKNQPVAVPRKGCMNYSSTNIMLAKLGFYSRSYSTQYYKQDACVKECINAHEDVHAHLIRQ